MNNLTPNMIAAQFIDPTYRQLSLTEQTKLLGISRGSLYYQPVPVDPQTLDLMHRIDKIHTDWPTYGSQDNGSTITTGYRTDNRTETNRIAHGTDGNRGNLSKTKSFIE
jgi:hypothetical protein